MSYPNVLYLSLNSNHWTLDVGPITFQDPFFKIFAKQPPVFIISFHLPRYLRYHWAKTHQFLAKIQFTHEKVLLIHKLWPTPLSTNIVTPNRLYTSFPAPMYIYAHCLFRISCFYLLYQLHIICYPALGPQGCY